MATILKEVHYEDKGKFIAKLNHLCMMVNQEESSSTSLDISKITQMDIDDFVDFIDKLAKEFIDLPAIQTDIAKLRKIIVPLTAVPEAQTDVSVVPEELVVDKIYTSFQEAQQIANKYNMKVISEQQGRDWIYRLCPKTEDVETSSDQKKPEEPQHEIPVQQEMTENNQGKDKITEEKKVPKRVGRMWID